MHNSALPSHPIHRMREIGQSVWLDFIDRRMLLSGELERMIEQDGLAGLTSNPTIFQKAIAASTDADSLIQNAAQADSNDAIFERVQVRDVALACDQFRSVYDATDGQDGFVSIEVSPKAARDTRASLEEAHRLWTAVGRPNLMVKIPGTREGLPAIEQCLADGININITLLFSVPRYLDVVASYLRALDTRLRDGRPIDRIASVASFFVSRVDTKIDRVLDALTDSAHDAARGLRGRIAIANATIAYDECERIVSTERWRNLASQGARRQRLLWASTSAKDPAYADTYYAEALLGPNTIDTMTLETFRAYVEHGHPEARLTQSAAAKELIGRLPTVGIDLQRVTDELEDEGVRLFAGSYDRALQSIAEKRVKLGTS